MSRVLVNDRDPNLAAKFDRAQPVLAGDELPDRLSQAHE
jgi:hypothetical protein